MVALEEVTAMLVEHAGRERRNASRRLTRALTMSLVSARRGSARIGQARPRSTSARPWNQPMILPSASRRAASSAGSAAGRTQAPGRPALARGHPPARRCRSRRGSSASPRDRPSLLVPGPQGSPPARCRRRTRPAGRRSARSQLPVAAECSSPSSGRRRQPGTGRGRRCAATPRPGRRAGPSPPRGPGRRRQGPGAIR